MHRIATFAFLLFAAAGQAQKPVEQPYEVTLRPSAIARGASVTLGDIIEITPADKESLAIAALRFGASPQPGFPRQVTRNDILQALAASGRVAGAFRWRGATESTLQTAVSDVTPSELTEAATTSLQAVIALDHDSDIEFELATRVRNVQAPVGARSRELKARVHDGQLGATTAVVDVAILVDGETYKTEQITFKLTRYRQVLKTTATVPKGGMFGLDNVALVREKVSTANTLVLEKVERAQGMVASRNLPPGQVLMLADMRPPAVIHAGDLVTVVLTGSRMRVELLAIANEDAAVGEPLRLTNPQSRQFINGVAMRAGLVAVPASR